MIVQGKKGFEYYPEVKSDMASSEKNTKYKKDNGPDAIRTHDRPVMSRAL
jgi:hypothetical protein